MVSSLFIHKFGKLPNTINTIKLGLVQNLQRAITLNSTAPCEMAGMLGAILRNPIFRATFPPFNPHFALITSTLCQFPRNPSRRICARALIMAQAAENPNHAPEIEEPSPKIQKIHQNGVSENKTHESAPFLRVKKLSEKAVLPSRASPLSAGYDLSRYMSSHYCRKVFYVPQFFSFCVFMC